MARLRPNIFNYHDYRAYLSDWLKFQKSDSGQSLRGLARASGLSATLLSLVVAQKRVLTERAAKKLIEALDLGESERTFFENLVRLAEAPSQAERVKAYRALRRFEAYRKSDASEVEAFKYLSSWYHVAIRELAAHPEFTGEIAWIQSRLVRTVSTEEIREALEFLVEADFLARDAAGCYSQTQRNLDCVSGVFQLSLNQFHKDVLSMATEAIDSMEKDKRNLTGYTFLAKESSYDEIVSILDEALGKLRKLESRDIETKDGQRVVFHTELITMPFTVGKQ